jgi:hypothetical protein
MTGDLIPTYDGDTGQVVLDGLPTGAAGGAWLVPAAGVELEFDRADGRLCRVVIDTGGRGGDTGERGGFIALDEGAEAVLVNLFGQQAPEAVRRTARQQGTARRLSPAATLCAALSDLARLEAARVTSPVPATSPWWAAEAARFAGQAGLHAWAAAEARRAARGLAQLLSRSALPETVSGAALAVADLAEADEPKAARQLREAVAGTLSGSLAPWLARQPKVPALVSPDEFRRLSRNGERIGGLQWAFDPSLVPEGAFLPGLSPYSDLLVRAGDGKDHVVVAALLAPGAEHSALSRCRARLVDPAARRVLASGSFTQAGSVVHAELRLPLPLDELGEAWVEVVQDEHRPVRSERLRRLRRALRWADAALRAEQRPPGLAPQLTGADWAALAATAWEICRDDWERAGDADRAYLAARRQAAIDPTTRVPAAPSAWAAKLADRAPLRQPAYLAETLGR